MTRTPRQRHRKCIHNRQITLGHSAVKLQKLNVSASQAVHPQGGPSKLVAGEDLTPTDSIFILPNVRAATRNDWDVIISTDDELKQSLVETIPSGCLPVLAVYCSKMKHKALGTYRWTVQG